jgi:hypothetical protein
MHKASAGIKPYRPVAAAVIDNINNNLPNAHLFRFERSNDSIPPRPP